MAKIGIYVYGFGTLAAGVFDLMWRGFDSAHQPIQAWGDHIPGLAILGCITGIWMVAGVLALLWRRTAQTGAAALAGIYFIFALFWLPRFYTAPHYLGVRIPVYIGVCSGVGIELITFAAALLLYGSLETRASSKRRMIWIARWTFGICCIVFGLAHLTNIKDYVVYVPKRLPPGEVFWVIVTGVCFVLAGLAILSGILDVLASWLLGVMFLSFNLTILPTYILADPHDHAAWGGNAYNLAAVGAAWILASALARRRAERQGEPHASMAQAT
jgi:uncharacterized membrane protein